MLTSGQKPTLDWFNDVGWEGNPFTLSIIPSINVGSEIKKKQLENHLKMGHKFALIAGSPGSGKTNLMKHIEETMGSDFHVIYFPKPPPQTELLDILLREFKPSFTDRILKRKKSLADMHKHIQKNMKKNVVILVDEAHEAETPVLMWLRTWVDQVDGCHVIFAGLDSFEDKLRDDLETLSTRINTKISLTGLTHDETRDLIKNRIEYHKGKDINPFTQAAIADIYEKTGGIPREVIKECDVRVRHAMETNVRVIDAIPEEVVESQEPVLGDILNRLPHKQKKILKLLSEEGEMTPTDLAEATEGKYKSKEHAIRSMNNILKRLMDEGYVDRKEWGKGYLYRLSVKVKNAFMNN